MEKKVEHIEEPFDYLKFRNNENYKLKTSDGKDVSYLNKYIINPNTKQYGFIGLIEENGEYKVIDWTENDKDTVIMHLEKVINYDHITSETIKDTENHNFVMTAVEYARYKAFCKDHSGCCKNMGAIGGGISVSFMPTGLGNCIKCECASCGTSVDITDISCW